MNFFERQEASRRESSMLVVLFLLAVLAVVVAVNAVVFLAFVMLEERVTGHAPSLLMWIDLHPQTVLVTTLIVVAIIGFASMYKSSALGGGGGVVARSLGGVRVSPDTTDPQQKRLLNVVEEMAIASGVPMPEVYVLEQERGINAFAAGHNPANAAIGVTRGTLATLNRAELQGVIAHEFSHILNGDMRLNIRLMGLLFGLLVIALIGRTVLRHADVGNKAKRDAASAVAIVAFAVLVIGYVGLFFGQLIQAAISRRRETLADASAVQFTRDPTGLRGALVKIGAAGSGIGHPEVEEVAHMLIAPGIGRYFETHPPLEERLKAIDPRFDKREFERVRMEMQRQSEQAAYDAAATKQTSAERLGSLVNLPGVAPAAVAGLVGNPGTVHMRIARDIRKSLPDAIAVASRHPNSAQVLLLALALDTNVEARERQRQYIGQQIGYEAADGIGRLLSEVDSLEPEQRMPALLRAIPALRQLTRDERMRLMATLNGMLQREGAVSLQNYVLRKLAQVHLYDDLNPVARTRHVPLNAVHNEIQVLFSVIAQHGHADAEAAGRAYEMGVHHLLPRERPHYVKLPHWAQPLDRALSRLDQLAPIMKEQLVEALVKTVSHDQKLTLGEAELLRAVCATVHCPLPPLVASGDSN
jgi:Zn-dependent protease with chaperone function